MNLLAPIATIMQTDLITISQEETLFAVGQLFDTYSIHHLPVVDGRSLIGIVSKSDYLFFRQFKTIEEDKERLESHRAKEIMTTGLAKLEPTDRINVALKVFKENIFHALPIVEQGNLVGIVSTYDFIKHLDEDDAITETYV